MDAAARWRRRGTEVEARADAVRVVAAMGAMESDADLFGQVLSNPDLSQKLIGGLIPILYEALHKSA